MTREEAALKLAWMTTHIQTPGGPQACEAGAAALRRLEELEKHDCDNCPACESEGEKQAYCDLCRCQTCKFRLRMSELERWARAWRDFYVGLSTTPYRKSVYDFHVVRANEILDALNGEMTWPEEKP